MSLGAYLLKRLITSVPLLLGAVTIIFVLIHAAPGDPTDYIIGDASVERSSAKQSLLHERCEAILAEARRFGDGAQAAASGAEASLRRIAKLASEALEGGVFEARASGAFLVPAAVNAEG